MKHILRDATFWNKRTGDGLKTAIEYFNHAIELDFTYAEAYSGLADAYALSGDWEYGVLSPQEPRRRIVHCPSRRCIDSQSRKALDLDPNFALAHYELGQALTQKHMYGEALCEFQRAIEIPGHNGAFDSNRAYVYAVTGRQEDAMKIAGDMAKHDENPAADANIALIYVGLGTSPKR
jgi:tetratricopeptide (TPR) repeat protein